MRQTPLMDRRRPVIAVIIVVLQILQLPSLAAWLFAAVFAVSAVGDRGANPGTFLAVGAILMYPVWLIGLGVLTWLLYRRDRAGWALVVAVVSSLPVLALMAVTLATL
jgi:hypothetical protein